MQQPTPTSGVQTSHPGATESTSSQAGFHANHFLKLVNGKELPTTATCGQKCFEQYAKSDRVGSWAKTFSALLLGMEGWFSSRCALTWKLRVTPFNRSYFQLAASTRHTKDTGHGLLPTVTTTNSVQGFNSTNNSGRPLLPMAALMLGTPTALAKPRSQNFLAGANRIPNPAEFAEMVASGQVEMNCGLLPTPTCSDMKGGQKVEGKTKIRQSGQTFTSKLSDLAYSRLLPTPNAREATNYATTYNPKSQMGSGLTARAVNGMLPTPVACLDGVYADKNPGKRHSKSIATLACEAGGQNSQLSPLFVEEMMGFPKYYTVLPFLGGEKSQSKHTVMQLFLN